MWMTMDGSVKSLRTRAMECESVRQSQLWNKCAVRADSVHVRHAIVDVNVVIGVLVVHGELLVVVRVVPVFLDCDAVVLIHFILIALYRSHYF